MWLRVCWTALDFLLWMHEQFLWCVDAMYRYIVILSLCLLYIDIRSASNKFSLRLNSASIILQWSIKVSGSPVIQAAFSFIKTSSRLKSGTYSTNIMLLFISFHFHLHVHHSSITISFLHAKSFVFPIKPDFYN